jgi:hypothetical protein
MSSDRDENKDENTIDPTQYPDLGAICGAFLNLYSEGWDKEAHAVMDLALLTYGAVSQRARDYLEQFKPYLEYRTWPKPQQDWLK